VCWSRDGLGGLLRPEDRFSHGLPVRNIFTLFHSPFSFLLYSKKLVLTDNSKTLI